PAFPVSLAPDATQSLVVRALIGPDGSDGEAVVLQFAGHADYPVYVAFQVRPPNTPPVPAGGSAFVTAEDTPLTGRLTADDAEGDPVTFSVVALPDDGSLTLQDDGSFVYQPPQDYFGTVSFRAAASDGELVSDPFDVSIEVTPVNDPPVVAPTAPV